MALLVTRTSNYFSDNIIDPIFSFEGDDGWTIATGNGSTNFYTSSFFQGNSCLRIARNDTEEILANNPNQSTIVDQDGDYILSFYAQYPSLIKKNTELKIEVFKNAVLLDTQIFIEDSFGEVF